jgi:outer membrane murein-binding lipoprotein Lpp
MAMRDHRSLAARDERTEVIDPYEPPEDPAYDWEYDDEPAYRRGPRVLWGRLVVLGVVLLVAFLIGRATGGGGIPQEDLNAARAERNDAQTQVQDLQQEVAQLENQNEALQNSLEEAEAAETPTDTTGEEDTAEEPAGETYVIQQDDTLRDIAIEFYGDATLDDYIAEANDIADPSLISAGVEIIIPPDPEP